MDQLQTRLDALEHQMHTVNRRLRWWRGLAGGLLGLAVLTWVLPAGTAPEGTAAGGEKETKSLEQRVAALESLLKHFSRKGNEVSIRGANLHIVNGLGSTDCIDEQDEPILNCPNGLGNLIVGYNELRKDESFCQDFPDLPFCTDVRTGSHNMVVGQLHNFSRFGGLVVGNSHTISGDFAVVSGGGAFEVIGTDPVEGNTASGPASVVSGGLIRTAEGEFDWVAGDLFEDE